MTARPRWRRWLRRFALGLAIAISLAIALAIVALALLRTDWGRRKAIETALDALNGSIRGTVRVERLEGNLPGTVALIGVEIDDPDGVRVLSVARIDVALDPWALVSRRVSVERLAIDAVDVTIYDDEGRVGLARAFEPVTPSLEAPEGTPSAWIVDVADVRITNAAVSLGQSASTAGDRGLSGLTVSGAVHIEGGEVRWTGLTVAAEARHLPVRRIELRTDGAYAADALTLDALEVTDGVHKVRLHGRITRFDDPELDLTLDGVHAALGALGIAELRGTADVTGSVTGTLGALLTSLYIVTPGGHIALTGAASLSGATPTYRVALHATRLAPGVFLPSFTLPLVADVRLTAAGAGNPMGTGRATAQVRLEHVEGVSLPGPVDIDARATAGALVADVVVDAGAAGRVAIHASAPHLPPGPVDATVWATGVDLVRWTGSLDLVGLAAHVRLLAVTAHADLPAIGLPEVRATVVLDAAGVATPWGEPATAGALSVDADLAWPGRGVPTGLVSVTVHDAAGAGALVSRVVVTADIASAGAGVLAQGRVVASDVDYDARGGADRLAVPFSLRIGPGPRPEGTATVTVVGARFDEQQVAEATFEATLSAEGRWLRVSGPIELTGLASGEGVAVAAVDGTVSAEMAPGGAISADVDLRTRHAAAPGATRVGSAHVTAHLEVSGSGSHGPEPAFPGGASLSGLVEASNFRAGTVSAGALDATFQATLRAGVPEGRVTLNAASVRLSGLALDRVHLKALARPNGSSHVALDVRRGSLLAEASLDLRGKLDGRSELTAALSTLRISDGGAGFEVAPGASVRWNPTTNAIDLRRLVVRDLGRAAGELSVSGRLAGSAVRARILGAKVPIGAWLGALGRLGVPVGDPVKGALTIDATVAGTTRFPEGTANVFLRDGKAFGLTDLTLDLRATAGAKGLTVAADAAWQRKSHLTLTASLPVRLDLRAAKPVPATAPVTVDATLDRVELADLAAFLPAAGPTAGRVDGAVALTGTLRKPVGTVDVTATGLVWAPVRDGRLVLSGTLAELSTALDVALSFGGQPRLHVVVKAPVNLVAAATGAARGETVWARLSREPLSVDLQLARTSLRELPLTSNLGRIGRAGLATSLLVTGTLGTPQVGGFVRVTDMHVGSRAMDATLRLATSGDTVSGSLAVMSGGRELGEATFDVPGAARAMTGDPLRLLDDAGFSAIVTSHVPLETLSDLAPWLVGLSRAVPSSDLSVSAIVRGGAGGPRANVHASLRSNRRQREAPLADSVRLALIADGRGARGVVLIDQGAGGGTIALSGAAGLRLADVLAGRQKLGGALAITGSATSAGFRLEGLSSALPDVFGPSRGILDVNAQLTGTVAEPRFSGRLEAHFDVLNLSVMGFAASDQRIALDFDEQRLRLTPLHFAKGGGTLDISLGVGLAPLDPAKMALEAKVAFDGFPALDRTDARAILTGQVAIAGTLASPDISGRIRLDDGMLIPDLGSRSLREVGLPEGVTIIDPYDEAYVLEADDADAEVPAAGIDIAGARLNVSIEIPPRALRVRNDLVDVWLTGDLDVITVSRRIAVTGVITIARGEVEYLGRRFQLSPDSRIVFDGSPVIDPSLSVTATYGIEDVNLGPLGLTVTRGSHVRVEVGGKASKPLLKLGSDPVMDDNNIASILATGSPLGGGSSTKDSSADAQVLSLFVGLAMGSVTRNVQEGLAVDVLRIEAGSGVDGLSKPEITLGKRFLRDLLVLYRASLAAKQGENTNELQVEYSITRFLSLESRFGDAGRGGLDLIFRWRF